MCVVLNSNKSLTEMGVLINVEIIVDRGYAQNMFIRLGSSISFHPILGLIFRKSMCVTVCS